MSSKKILIPGRSREDPGKIELRGNSAAAVAIIDPVTKPRYLVKH
jgi:hypothetical protein